MDTILARAAENAEPGLVAAGVYARGQRVQDIRIEEAGAWSRKEGRVVWIGLYVRFKRMGWL